MVVVEKTNNVSALKRIAERNPGTGEADGDIFAYSIFAPLVVGDSNEGVDDRNGDNYLD
eukprot:Pgem_evm1s9964